MTTAPRTIRIRRPPTLRVIDEPFLPRKAASISLDAIDARWAAMCESNPRFFDGPTYHVLGVHRNGAGGVVLHVVETSFRYLAVQQHGPDLGVRGLGVHGITHQGDTVLIGQRSNHVACYPGQWEFMPAGTLEPDVDPTDLLARELAEECGLTPSAPPRPLAVLYDPIATSWQLLYAMRIEQGAAAAMSDEHTSMRWCRPDDIPAGLSPVDRMKLPLLDGLGLAD